LNEDGYSAIEMLVVLGILAVVSAGAVVQIARSVPAMKADGAMRVVMGQLSTARELAIGQRRFMQVRFLPPNRIQIVRTEVDASGATTGATVLSTVTFEGGITYLLNAGLPDTPDAFGLGAAISFGSATTIQFNTEGRLVDQAGNPLNGTVVLASPQGGVSSRAVTVFGSTGRIRGYRWNSKFWELV
jgi:prepilin-type N-terminal cleavage/methylation domain-containing protein